MGVSRLLPLVFLGFATLLCMGCHSIPPLTEYPTQISLSRDREGIGQTQIILVGKISSYSELGHPRNSRWSVNYPIQLVRVTVQAETVLQAYTLDRHGLQDTKAPEGEVPVYYFYSPEAVSSVPWMGMEGRGGHWKLGDRVMFFLQRENGYLRTVCDQWNQCAPTVYTGAHPGYRPRSKDVTTSIIEILLTRGQGATDQQMIQAIEKFRLYDINAGYAVQTLQGLARQETPQVRRAAGARVALMLGSNCEKPPQWTKGAWGDPCFEYLKEGPPLSREAKKRAAKEQNAALASTRAWLAGIPKLPTEKLPVPRTTRANR